MGIKALYAFTKGGVVPHWLYDVREAGASEAATCTFGCDGSCAVMTDGTVCVWGAESRREDEYIFVIDTFVSNGIAAHPAGEALLKVLQRDQLASYGLDGVVAIQGQPLVNDDPRV